MTTINDQPQHLLARYADRTGAKWELQATDLNYVPTGSEDKASAYVRLGNQIRLVLSEYGLPSHLKPYKDNPRLPGDGYRVPTGEDSCNQPHELWSDGKWIAARQVDVDFSNLSSDYRLPASVLPPDWEEMTKEDASADASQHPEIFEAHSQEWYRHDGNDKCPCDQNLIVEPLFRNNSEGRNRGAAMFFRWYWNGLNGDIIGWRPVDAPAKLPCPEQQPQDEVHALKARVQELEESLKDSEYTLEVTKKEVERQKEGWKTAHRERNNHFDQSCLNLQRAEAAEKQVQELKEKVRAFDDAWASREAEYAAASTPTLRPIVDPMPPVSEGCVRTWYRKAHGTIVLASPATAEYFGDARIPEGIFPAPPDPDEELRREFEAWWESLQTKPPGKNELFIAFKAGHTAR